MNRLVAFGCSHTYGQALDDCYTEGVGVGPHPSQYAWPSILGKKLNLTVINKAQPAASNFEILYRLLNFEFDKNDLVIILWSYFFRDTIFQKKDSLIRVMPRSKSINQSYYYNVHNNYDLHIRSYFHIHHADQFFKIKKIKYKGFLLTEPMITVPEYLDMEKLNNIDLEDIRKNYDVALDNMHPGKESQKEIANRILKFI